MVEILFDFHLTFFLLICNETFPYCGLSGAALSGWHLGDGGARPSEENEWDSVCFQVPATFQQRCLFSAAAMQIWNEVRGSHCPCRAWGVWNKCESVPDAVCSTAVNGSWKSEHTYDGMHKEEIVWDWIILESSFPTQSIWVWLPASYRGGCVWHGRVRGGGGRSAGGPRWRSLWDAQVQVPAPPFTLCWAYLQCALWATRPSVTECGSCVV